ncbi:hypothetical protein B0H67DRAFT_478288 [Lasiosphaeris hirsuta]|uniref:Uncharacterized protein n=1 Tax=Lasiosphaeris hirsuta TaxID=260670 RepID=A0AA40BB54_9PEZI|nr:hypothetical protein B0H67DRAFT_478288 [Lasiosphaeris hirsuta]
MSLAGKVFIITGASRGIGKAIAERVASDGASVVINYLSNSQAADEVVAKIGSDRALAVQADASKISDIEKLVSATVNKFSKIDVVIPNGAWHPSSGIMPMRDLAGSTEADFDQVFDLNVKGPLFLAQKAVPHMPTDGTGRVILVSTGLNTSTSVAPGYLLYVASKGAVDQLTRVLSKDLGKKNITVNAIAPGPTGTDLFFEGKSEQLLSAIRSQSPLNRLGTPEEIADVAAFMAGDGSRWVSGQTIRVNGANMV